MAEPVLNLGLWDSACSPQGAQLRARSVAPPSDWVGGPPPGWPHRGELFSFCPSFQAVFRGQLRDRHVGSGRPHVLPEKGAASLGAPPAFQDQGSGRGLGPEIDSPVFSREWGRDGVWQVRCGFESYPVPPKASVSSCVNGVGLETGWGGVATTQGPAP